MIPMGEAMAYSKAKLESKGDTASYLILCMGAKLGLLH
jgi:hypothetical protein